MKKKLQKLLSPSRGLLLYYVVILVLSVAVGYYVKSLARNYVTVGFEDDKVTTAKSDYSAQELKDKIKELQEEALAKQQEAAAAAQAQAENGADTTDTANTGGSCGN